MPEIRSRVILGGAHLAMARRRQLRGGEYGILRGLGTRTRSTCRPLSADSNKENIPPWAVGVRRPARRWGLGKRKSPLPTWFPRTPLRDITAIVNAIERRRASLQTGQERNASVFSHAGLSLTGSVPGEPDESEATPPNPSEMSHTSTSKTVTDSDAVNPCQESNKKSKFMEELEIAAMENLEEASNANVKHVYNANVNQKRRSKMLMSMR